MKFISIGSTCTSHSMIQAAGFKYRAYPFDQIFSSIEIVKECIEDKFEKFFNKECIEKRFDEVNSSTNTYFQNKIKHPIIIENCRRNGHNIDTVAIFLHHNLTDQYIYDAFVRRSNRFIEAINNDEVVLVYSIENVNDQEVDKYFNELNNLIISLKKINCNIKILATRILYNSNNQIDFIKSNNDVYLYHVSEIKNGGELIKEFYNNLIQEKNKNFKIDNLFTLMKWEEFAINLCKFNNNFILGDILTFNNEIIDEEYFNLNKGKNIILLNGDCDFPPPIASNTYEFDKKFNGINNELVSKPYKEMIDYRILDIIEKYNINIYCLSSSVYHKNVKVLPIGTTWQVPIPEFVLSDEKEKNILCYANFGIPCDRWFGNPRIKCLNKILSKNFIIKENCILDNHIRKSNNDYNNYFLKLKSSKFSICPRGCGIDCYRIYDCILSNCIPIMLKNEDFYKNFKDLPILFINDYDELNEEFLNDM